MLSSSQLVRSPLVTFSYFAPSQTQLEDTSYENLKRKLASSLQRDTYFGNGLLLEATEKGVSYPIIHCAPHNGSSFGAIKSGLGTFNDEYLVEQGCYQELAYIQADLFGQSLDDILTSTTLGTAPKWNTFYVVLGFKRLPTSPFRDILESDWKDWTGARYLYLNLPDEYGLLRLTFYRRKSPDHLHLFLYVLLAECVHVLQSPRRVFLKDFVQRLRADQMPQHVALYEQVQGRGARPSALAPLLPRWRHRSLSGSTAESSSLSPFSEDRLDDSRIASPLFASPVPLFRSTFTFSTI